MLYVKRFINFILDLVGWKNEVSEPTPPKRRRYKKRQPYFKFKDGQAMSFPQTLSELLDNLQKMFKVIQLPVWSSWIPADERVAFTRLGIYVPHPFEFDWPKQGEQVCVKSLEILPTMIALALPHEDEEDKVWPHVFFCFKLSRLPLGVEPLKGHPYRVGMVLNIYEKTLWLTMYMVIDKKTGELRICKEERHEIVTVGKNKTSMSYNRRWNGNPAMYFAHNFEKQTIDNVDHTYKCLFKTAFDWWVERKDQSWNVAVKKGKQKLTFAIGRSETKKYFADRDKTVNKKKIIHFVREHERTVKGRTVTIKEHLRGLDKFVWNGYSCVVTAPKFSLVSSAVFNLTPTEVDDDAANSSEFVGASKLVEFLNEHEERRYK